MSARHERARGGQRGWPSSRVCGDDHRVGEGKSANSGAGEVNAEYYGYSHGRAGGLSAINTINSITGIDLQTLVPRPNVDGKSSHGGYCGPAVKPIALNMVASVAADTEVRLPISGIGGISNWRDAAEFMVLGASTVQ